MRLTRPWISVLLGLFLLLVNVTSSFAAEVPTQVPAKGVMYTTGGSPVAFEGETPDGVTPGNCGDAWVWLIPSSVPGFILVDLGVECHIGWWTGVSYTWQLYRWSSTTGYTLISQGSGGDNIVYDDVYRDEFLVPVYWSDPAEYYITVDFFAGVVQYNGLPNVCTGFATDFRVVAW